jgi:tetratricopeptide (TPR) repeat protein
MQIHPSDLFLKETFQEPAGRSPKVLSHVRECPRCQKRLKDLLSAYWSRKPDYEPALDRSFSALQHWQRMYAKERAEAPQLLAALLDQPVERQKLLLRNHARFQTWSLCESLLRLSHERVFTNAIESENLAQRALFLSNHLNSGLYGPERIEDLRARSWGYIANSQRVRYDIAKSKRGFKKAFSHLRKGTGDTVERAALLELEALRLKREHCFSECRRVLQRAMSRFREVEDSVAVGRCLEAAAETYYHEGEFEKAIQGTRDALVLLTPSPEPRDLFCARHNLVLYLADAGLVMEAQGLLARIRPLYQKFPEPYRQSRLKWVEAKVARGLGRYREAKLLLQQAHEGLLAAKLPHDAALAFAEIVALPNH